MANKGEEEPLPERIFKRMVFIRILKAFAPGDVLRLRNILERSQLDQSRYDVKSRLHYLVKLGVLQETRFGQVRSYKLRIEDRRVRELINRLGLDEKR